MSYDVKLPRLAATRETAQHLLETCPDDFGNQPVKILARLLSTSTASFTDELVRLLGQRHASELVLIGAPSTFESDAESAGERRRIPVRVGTERDL